ncbi:TdeIII family type II restriction endonuclease [Umezakia ovalisporum]|uniref:TdeIII family type II restriction endonuclease n=1 Tax=Umezakia ovalisporum TaxID=75695 RepID=UPI0024754EF0|nr:TdeIII family type II restriction endonuclease [Umezakia ovalisporum]MDH6075619.1 TdeIII family type II restriction endonuclease [Umezakia ovalisporum CS-1034]MDH6086528.1 TdeIII family type II restriction endonuclease [Umezakia ovalisporum TAC611]
MDENIKLKIKENLKESIISFFKDKTVKNYQILDEIFPNERRIRSLIGGLETSLGTNFWEPISKTLAKMNGFEIITEKILIPTPFPEILQNELDKLVYEREHKPNNKRISTKECIDRLRNAATKINPQNMTKYILPPKGTGVDLHLSKDGIEYLFDIKTAQPNLADFQKFNKQILQWYAYKLAKDTNCNLEARIAIPFNPFNKPWYEEQKSKLSNSPLDIHQDIWVENEFWDFCSGIENTFEQLKSLFVELGQDDFAAEFNDIFYKNKSSK